MENAGNEVVFKKVCFNTFNCLRLQLFYKQFVLRYHAERIRRIISVFMIRRRYIVPIFKDKNSYVFKETVAKLLARSFKEDKTKVSSDAVMLVAEMLKVFVEEATRRAVKQADSEDCDTVDIEHFEKILPQLLLDF
uniref:Centromere protein X n=2 Tax=Cyprinus carpio TaxID=7962 RepID=A0A8C0YCR4_CYPCA